jgi:CDP-diglyceride synthetase|tara:strand:+ start:133 stop:279 length:147 start_codon:yes stop_codon:yes gene_type:complete
MIPITGALLFPFYVYQGYFWLVVTNGSVMMNDIMAFVFGKAFGRTKLI